MSRWKNKDRVKSRGKLETGSLWLALAYDDDSGEVKPVKHDVFKTKREALDWTHQFGGCDVVVREIKLWSPHFVLGD